MFAKWQSTFDTELSMGDKEADRDANMLKMYQYFVEYCHDFLPNLMGILRVRCNQDHLAGNMHADSAPAIFLAGLWTGSLI